MTRNLVSATALAFFLASLGDAKNIRDKASGTPKANNANKSGRVKGIKGKTPQQLSPENGERRAQYFGEDEDGDEGIIGGMSAVSGEFPFFVKFEGNTLCGGSLISPDTVLTAAHCVDQGKPNQVRIGSDMYDSGGIVVNTECVVSHPDFIENDKTLMNDVAILKLAQPVTDASVATINYNTNTAYPSSSGTELTVIGFGITSNDGGVANTLQKLKTSFVSIDQCMNTYGGETIVAPDKHICADVSNAGDCNGDSGGPVFAGGLQVGIVSFGYGGCASAQYQDVYVNVAAYSDWITAYVNGASCQPSGEANVDTAGSGTDPDDEEEPADVDVLLDCFTTVLDMVQGFLGGGNGKGGGNNDKDDNKGGGNDAKGDEGEKNQGGKGTFLRTFLYGEDLQPGGEHPGFVGSVTNLWNGIRGSSAEELGDNAETLGKALGVPDRMDEMDEATENNDGGR